ncbi:MAG: NAD(P)-dependent oxidoreductase [Gemmatimonadaceae bacterium]
MSEDDVHAPLNESELEELLSHPSDGVVDAMRRITGDIVILGAGGKMGPSLARMARRALDAVGRKDRVIAVSRFSAPGAEHALAEFGVETVKADLTDTRSVEDLPDAANVLFLAGHKFGTTGNPSATWASNAAVPAIVAQRFTASRIVVFSTGNVYPLSAPIDRGSVETDPVGPVGEYSFSCLGRERIFQYYAEKNRTRVAIMRLNYAVDLRYGVLTDIASKVFHSKPIDVRMGHVNVIWQGDANARAIRMLEYAASPPFILNITGRETISVRDLAKKFGERFRRPPVFTGLEEKTSLLSNAARSEQLFGMPAVPLDQLIAWTAVWVRNGGHLLDKPTHFEARDGKF